MIKKRVFTGSGTAVITPFRGGKVDYESLGKLIEFQIDGGTDAIIVCGTTGESATLNDRERREIIAFAVKKADGRIPVIAGTGCNNISHAVELSKYAEASGADAVMTVTPYYNKASASGLIRSFTSIADSVNIPVMLYNVPSRTGVDIPIEVYRVLCEHENICAVKEASGNIKTAARILKECAGKLDVYSGNDDITVPIMALGGIGVVSVVSNIMPREVHALCEHMLNGRMSEGARAQLELLDACDVLFDEVNPIPIKTAASMLGLCLCEFRLPLCEMDKAKTERMVKVLEEYGLVF